MRTFTTKQNIIREGQKILFRILDYDWLSQIIHQGIILQVSPSGDYAQIRYGQEDEWLDTKRIIILEVLEEK